MLLPCKIGDISTYSTIYTRKEVVGLKRDYL
jgi:hypothetical protein